MEKPVTINALDRGFKDPIILKGADHYGTSF